jgi:dTDP-4-dehydrorhamnose 3,5-epimerase
MPGSLAAVQIEALSIDGAWLCTPQAHTDDRGVFVEWFRGDALAAATGRAFDIVQANHSVSRRGVVRGIHFADVPPGQAKYVYCPRGAVIDIVVDVRVGSPTYGAHHALRLDEMQRQGVFVAEGLGHGFCALTEDADVTYLLSSTYDPAAEHGIDPFDPALGLPWPTDVGELLLSEKDRVAPTLAVARDGGVLPTYDDCRARYAAL